MASESHTIQLSKVGIRLTLRKECDLESTEGLIPVNPALHEEGRDWLMTIRAGEMHAPMTGWVELCLQAVELTGFKGLNSTLFICLCTPETLRACLMTYCAQPSCGPSESDEVSVLTSYPPWDSVVL